MAKRDLHNVLFPKQRKILTHFGEDLRLSQTQATQIYDEVLMVVKQWQTVAKRLGISRAEYAMKQSAFNV